MLLGAPEGEVRAGKPKEHTQKGDTSGSPYGQVCFALFARQLSLGTVSIELVCWHPWSHTVHGLQGAVLGPGSGFENRLDG